MGPRHRKRSNKKTLKKKPNSRTTNSRTTSYKQKMLFGCKFPMRVHAFTRSPVRARLFVVAGGPRLLRSRLERSFRTLVDAIKFPRPKDNRGYTSSELCHILKVRPFQQANPSANGLMTLNQDDSERDSRIKLQFAKHMDHRTREYDNRDTYFYNDDILPFLLQFCD